MAERAKKIEGLQGIRAAAFLMVFLYHCKIGDMGPLGVSVFFILSGYLMVYSYLDRVIDGYKGRKYLFGIRKICKLYPLHIITLISAVVHIVCYSHFSGGVGYNVLKALTNVTLMQTWVPLSAYYYSFNGVSWYLSASLFLYTCFPIIIAKVKKLRDIKTAFICMALIYGMQFAIAYLARLVSIPGYNEDFVKWVTYICPAFRLGDFCIGGLAAFVYKNRQRKQCSILLANVLELFAVSICVLAQMVYSNKIGPAIFRKSMLFTPASVLLIVCFHSGRGIIHRLLCLKPLQFIGEMSGYAFLIHQMVIRYLESHFKHSYGITLDSGIKAILTFSITIILCQSYHYIDRKLRTKRTAINLEHQMQ